MSEVNEVVEVKFEPVLTGASFDKVIGKWCGYHYGITNGKEFIRQITSYMFDDEKSALKYIQEIAWYKKRKPETVK